MSNPTPITDHSNWRLVHDTTRLPVHVGDILIDFRGDPATAIGGRCPHKAASTGRIIVNRLGNEFFPGVFDCHWTNEPA